jgi:hypothetical protein
MKHAVLYAQRLRFSPFCGCDSSIRNSDMAAETRTDCAITPELCT